MQPTNKSQYQIVSLLDVFPDMTGLSLVFEYMPHTLYSKLKDDLPMSRLVICSYTKMLLDGVKYMHDLGIMHRVCVFRVENNIKKNSIYQTRNRNGKSIFRTLNQPIY